jgi:hypothetical protein
VGRSGHDPPGAPRRCRPAGGRLAGRRVDEGRLRPDLAQGPEEGRGGVDEQEAAAAAGPDRQPVGLQNAVKSASNPSSGSYGKYPSLSTLQSKYGASSSKRKGVVNAFKKQSVKATVDVTHLRVSATPTIGKAQKLFGTKWAVYKTKSGAKVALPVNTPKLPSGMKGNVDTVAGTRLQLSQGSSSAHTSAVNGGTPTRTGTPTSAARRTTYPSAARSASGLFPNQILTAYGIAPVQARASRARARGSRSSARRRPLRPTSTRSAPASGRAAPR